MTAWSANEMPTEGISEFYRACHFYDMLMLAVQKGVFPMAEKKQCVGTANTNVDFNLARENEKSMGAKVYPF